MENEKELICGKCNIPLEKLNTKFSYLKYEFSHPIYKCPTCGQAFISEELVKGKIAELETILEGK